MKIAIAVFILGSLLNIVLAEKDNRCPLINDPNNLILLPHESDCTLFYKCDWGQTVLFHCPPGLHFNPRLKVCDWPQNAGCVPGDGGETTVATQAPDTTTTLGGGEGTENPETTTQHEVEIPDNPERDPRCPETNDYDETIHLPHEYDCTLFYKCDWGKAVLTHCPPGLHFNPKLSVCDWPQNAGCVPGDGGETTVATQAPDTTTTLGGGEGPENPETTTQHEVEIPGNPERDPRCPETNDYDETIHLPHEYDCTLFYKCDWGKAVLTHCPPGLHFNPKLSVCDWPQNAGCVPGDGGETTVATQAPDTTTTLGGGENPENPETTTQHEVEIPGNPERDPRCPETNDYDETIHLPHEYDCTLFYKCDWGKAVLTHCPPGLHFNPKLSVCDWPQNAGCVPGDGGETTVATQAPDTTTTLGGGEGTENPETTTQHEVEIPGNPERDPRCPETNDYDETIHLPHEYDCTLFYKCDWGQTVLFHCPPGLHFNPKLSVCDWPQNAGCVPGDGGETTVATQAPDTTTTSGGGENPENPETTTQHEVEIPGNPERDPRCPETNDYDETIHLPHEYDCTLFYKCDWGKAVLTHCPPGLHFNPKLSVCDWPQNAGCVA